MTNHSKVSIKYKNILEYEYTSENKYSFSDFCSNIGGLFGLWFGLSLLDMSEMLSQSIRLMKRFFLILIDIEKIITILARLKSRKTIKLIILLLKQFRLSIDFLDKINWKNVVKVFTIPFMLYQIWNLTDDYLKYPIDVSVEWFPLRDSLNRLSNNSIPAITVCYEHIFERILFDDEVKESFRYNLNLTNYNHLYKYKIKYDLPDNIKYLNDSYLKKLIYHYYFHLNSFKLELPENIRETLLYYLNVNNRKEFIGRQLKLNDKTSNDFTGIQRQLDFFQAIIKMSNRRLFKIFLL